ncbi:DUF2264 domain-containing protein [Martelella endophytica]|uniref:DUF2264 domain-containing protein n=1 Tax=Martelella endophytica TaxID=1486262 RepID=A0A0D5LM54_MAREN|nr:DUF2264 domain-containing protein [Martelella endophytica]AJY45025.1 hypothetical protein TM49_03900 [Martelella endophytica]
MSLLLEGFSDNPMTSRADFQRAAEALVAPLLPHLEAGGAAIDLGEGAAKFDMRAASLEGVARPFWGLVPYALGGGAFGHWQTFRDALAEGTDPEHPRYWGPVGDIDQRSVEMAAIGFLLAALPSEGWEPLEPRVKSNLAIWLADIQKRVLAANNWQFFTVLVQEGLRRVGRGDLVDEAVQRRNLGQLSSWYRADGWYGDGGSGAIDHYGGFAMHFYGLLYAWLKGNETDKFSELFRARARHFAEPFAHWFAENGEAMIEGRSLTYRFATAGFWGMLALSGERPLSVGQIKGLWARQLRLWRKRPIFRPDGVLSRGYAYPNLAVCEEYNSPTSPYWALKAFMPLAMPEESDFWQAEEEPLDAPRKVYPMPGCDTLVQRTGGHAIAHFAAPIHQWLQIDKYNKFAYSTLSGFDVGALQYANMNHFGDNILAFSFDGGANWQMRQENLSVSLEGETLSVRWRSGLQEVETTITITDDGRFTREHSFVLDRPAILVETGFAVNQWYQEAERLDNESEVTLVLKGENAVSAISALDDLPRAKVDSSRTNSNMLSPRTRIPGLRLELAAGAHVVKHAFRLARTDG